MLPHVNRNPRSHGIFRFACIQKTFSVVSYQSRSFILAQFRSIRTLLFFNFLLFTKKTHVALIVNLNTLKVFLGFRFRLKWVFRQCGSEVIEFWGFNVEREMKKKKTLKMICWVAPPKMFCNWYRI